MGNSKSNTKFINKFFDFSVGKKLSLGFGSVLLILVLLVTFIEIKLMSQDTLQNRVVELRFPTNIAGHDLVNGINFSLAALRGYMILNKEVFKEQRTTAWLDIDKNLNVMTEMSKQWTEPKNIEKLKKLKGVLAEFKDAQKKVEDISHSEDEQPAMKILLTEAAPRAAQIVKSITGLIDEEKKLESTNARKALLATFADSRGSFAMGLASIRAYLISGDSKWEQDFKRRWDINEQRFQTISNNLHLLNSKQKEYFTIYQKMRNEFEPFPQQMFDIRGSSKWNMANYLLGKEAAPKAKQALAILKNMVKNQNNLVKADINSLQEQSRNIKLISIIATLLALVIGIGIAYFITKVIVSSLKDAISASKRIAEGDLTVDIQVKSKDETGQLLLGMKQMQNQLTQVIEKDVQLLVDMAKEGNLSQRIELNDKRGFYQKLSESINELVNVNEQVVSDTVRMFSAMANGDLSQRITNNYKGDFNNLKQDANQTVEKLTQVIEGDIQNLVNAAQVGDLSKRINQTDKEGFFDKLCDGINKLVTVSELVVNDTVEMFGAMSQGDLSNRITNEYKGSFELLKNDANRTVEKLTQVIEGDIQQLINAARKGDLTQRIPLNDKSGFFETLSQGVNDLIDVNERVINDTVSIMSAMSAGDLTKSIDTDYYGTFGKLKDDTNSTINQLTQIISTITSSASLVDSASSEIAMGNDDLSSRTEQQAASLEETASAMEEIASTVRQNTESIENVNTLVIDTQKAAQLGGEVVNSAVESMAEISSSSKEISNIINVIDEIAFQTNLLALNAAVEAARAGEQGRGFAVVAAEVRNLAQRSSQAASEIKTLIGNSVVKVNQGTNLVNKSGTTLTEIVSSVKKVCDIISDIASSAREQSIGLDQVNVAIAQMDEMTLQNAALVEEATAASRSLADQASDMSKELQFFSIIKSTNVSKPNKNIPPKVTKPSSKNNKDTEWEEF